MRQRRRRPAIVDAVHATYADIALNAKRGTARDVQFLDAAARELIEEGGAHWYPNVGIKNDQ